MKMNWRQQLSSNIAFVSMLVTIWMLLSGCPNKQQRTLPDISNNIKDATARIETSVERIDTQAVVINDVAPEPSRIIRIEAANIKNETTELKDASADLKIAQNNNEKLTAKITSLEATVKKLEAEKYGLIAKMLAALAVSSLIFAVFSVFILKSMRLAAFGAALFSVAVAAQWLLNYALIIGLVIAIVFVGIISYVIWRERKSLTDVVRTVETIKGNVPNFREVANAIQGRATSKVVHKIKGAIK